MNWTLILRLMRSMPMPTSPRLMMALTGALIGLVSGIVPGAFAVIATRLTRPSRAVAAPGTVGVA